MADENAAGTLIERLCLERHPEGGWYRETWRADAAAGERSAGTTILFLLGAGQSSHWHRVDAEEIWFWHAGAPLDLLVAADGGPVDITRMGGDILAGQQPQARVPTGLWQTARPVGGWTLVSCAVVPGFDFAGFTLAPPGWALGA